MTADTSRPQVGDFREVSLLARQFYDRIQRGENMAAVLHHLVQYPPYVSQAITMRMSRIASAPLATAMIDTLVAMYERAQRTPTCAECGATFANVDGHRPECSQYQEPRTREVEDDQHSSSS